MQKKIADEEKTFRSVKLYKKDIEELLNIFTSTFGGYRLSDKKYDYDTFAEVQEKKGSVIKELTIASPSSSLILTFGSESNLRRTGEPEAVAAFPKVMMLLNDCKRPVMNQFLHLAVYIAFFVVVVGALILSKRKEEWVQGL